MESQGKPGTMSSAACFCRRVPLFNSTNFQTNFLCGSRSTCQWNPKWAGHWLVFVWTDHLCEFHFREVSFDLSALMMSWMRCHFIFSLTMNVHLLFQTIVSRALVLAYFNVKVKLNWNYNCWMWLTLNYL